MNTKYKGIQQKGSALVFSLIVLSFLLIASLSLAALSVSETRSAISLDRSVVAFQIADSGIEVVLEKIYKGTCNGQNLDCLGACNLQNSKAGITGTVNSGAYRVEFYDQNGSALSSCNTSTWRADTESIQSEGTYKNTTRAVKVDVNPV